MPKKSGTPGGKSSVAALPSSSHHGNAGGGSEEDEPPGGTLAMGAPAPAASSTPVSPADAHDAFEREMRGHMLNQQRLSEALQAKMIETNHSLNTRVSELAALVDSNANEGRDLRQLIANQEVCKQTLDLMCTWATSPDIGAKTPSDLPVLGQPGPPRLPEAIGQSSQVGHLGAA